MKKIFGLCIIVLLLAGCTQQVTLADGNLTSTVAAPTSQPSTATTASTPTPSPTPAMPSQTVQATSVPPFDHIVLIVLENEDYQKVIGNPQMPYMNALAKQNVLLTNYYAVSHPSLPNYIALVSGGTQGITSDCKDCFVNAPNLADLIEGSGRTWKTYQESMPAACTVGDAGNYAQKHNPFVYFDLIRLDPTRCDKSVVPLTQLSSDLAANQLPNFAFIMPNLCNSGHDCSSDVVDAWVQQMVMQLQSSSALGSNSLIAITYDEGSKDSVGSCCGMGKQAGGKVATILISPDARPGFADATAYSHYSLLKTILTAWNLKLLGATQKDTTPVITAPWIKQTSLVNPTPTRTSLEPTSTLSGVTPTSGGQLSFPIRAAFYYPWFPEAWKQSWLNPFTQYQPSLGFYSQDEAAVIQNQIAAMRYGNIQVGIASWWGQGSATDSRIPLLLKQAEQAAFYWTLYVESEGSSDPTAASIQRDLEYIQQHYASSPAFLKIDGRMVVFVYADANDRCGMVDRWTQGNTVNAYLVLKVFPGYRSCTNQPDAWHQYGPVVAQKQVGSSSFTISPGFWKAGTSNASLVRDLARWNQDIQAMLAADVKFELITTFNEWGEGTAIESAVEWQSASGYGLYLDALHNNGKTQ